MTKLTDKEIRQSLIANLAQRKHPPKAILEEIHACNGSAIADIVAIYKSLHCYEIKGETDSINRIVHQAKSYDLAFPLISLVTTANHAGRAIAIAPSHWAIIVAATSGNGFIRFQHIRGVSRNPFYQPEAALLSLWRSELLALLPLPHPKVDKLNRKKLAAEIAGGISVKVINEKLGEALTLRRSVSISPGSPEPYR